MRIQSVIDTYGYFKHLALYTRPVPFDLSMDELIEITKQIDVLITESNGNFYLWLDEKGKLFRQR